MKFQGNSFRFVVSSGYPAYVQDFLDRMTARDVAAGDSGGLQIGVTDLISNTLQGLVNGGFLTVSANVISAANSIIKTGGFLTAARTIQGAFTPWGADTAIPTIFNFVAGDYNRKTGALGNGTSKYVTLGVNNNAVPQNSCHQSIYVSQAGTTAGSYIAGGPNTNGVTHILSGAPNGITFRNRSANVATLGATPITGFVGHSRSNSANYSVRYSGISTSVTQASETPANFDTALFARLQPAAQLFSNGRLAPWSFGAEINDLVALETIINGYIASLSSLTLT